MIYTSIYQCIMISLYQSMDISMYHYITISIYRFSMYHYVTISRYQYIISICYLAPEKTQCHEAIVPCSVVSWHFT